MFEDLLYLLKSAFAEMPGILDFVDILIVAFIIYKLIDYLRRTRTANVTKGILLLIAALWISNLLNLSMVNFLLGKTLEIGFLAIIILFQPELRRILESVGSNKLTKVFGWQADSQAVEKVITQTVLACTEMAESRTGALIIFEREIRLDDPIKTGTVLNADVTAELLKNLFFDMAPLHDGAVIIRDGRIISAGCMLPLSTNVNISRSLGMRHRSALGMSEQSDAISVVVSEETGAISVAVSGILKRHLSPSTFEILLRKELVRTDESKEKGSFVNRIKGKIYVKKNSR